ncbi:MAG: hypothetical protein MZW92_12580 [Comamonadaceae bacterium]|nr:hypothetical protein [Comamonadaceae bacterium]
MAGDGLDGRTDRGAGAPARRRRYDGLGFSKHPPPHRRTASRAGPKERPSTRSSSSAATRTVPPALLEQLAVGGRMAIPARRRLRTDADAS